MSTTTIETITRGAGGAIGRRRTLTTAAALLGTALPAARSARARKGGNGAGSRCKRQRDQCLTFLEERCVRATETRTGAEPRLANACVDQNRPCCEQLGKCHAGAGLDCLFLRAVK